MAEPLHLGFRAGLQGIPALPKLHGVLCNVLLVHFNEDRGSSFPWILKGALDPSKVKNLDGVKQF